MTAGDFTWGSAGESEIKGAFRFFFETRPKGFGNGDLWDWEPLKRRPKPSSWDFGVRGLFVS